MSSLITTAKFRRLVHFLILIRVKFLKDLGAVHTWCVGTSVWVLPQNGGVSSQFEYPISDYVHPAGFLKTLSPNGSFASNNFFGQKLSKVAIINLRVQPFLFFSSFPFVLLALSFSPFLFARYCDSRGFWRKKTCLLTLFHLHDCKYRWVRFQKID